MSRVQCLVHRQKRILMVKHRHEGEEWWCLPGGRLEAGETPEQAALRVLHLFDRDRRADSVLGN